MESSELAPQMAEYGKFVAGDMNWQPYVMFANRPDYRSPVVNTDAQGFRLSYRGDVGQSLNENRPKGPLGVLMGGSSAFGFGAGSDSGTVSSAMADESGIPWLNFAVPGYNSTQETILFMMHRHQLPEVRDIVVLSGLNNLVVAGLPGADQGYGQFFFSGEFFGELGGGAEGPPRPPTSRTGDNRSVVQRLRSLIGSRPAPAASGPAVPVGERVDIAARFLRHDLDRLLDLVAPTGARVHYALQPTPVWSRKSLSAEEAVLLGDDGSLLAQAWPLFLPVLDEEAHERYSEEIGRACKERDIAYVDINMLLRSAPEKDEWLFVDAVHTNDRGNAVVAQLLCENLGLAR
ncbi:SGNH/GDSL hydrolase family protein [Streptomyces sp. NPDC088387]|uniref:SGNH/GDSL hydrolase family protein n=1 Tax=Streptomyces sp. NPDC088387 TaxID=3365859 RepID=UPI00381FDB09